MGKVLRVSAMLFIVMALFISVTAATTAQTAPLGSIRVVQAAPDIAQVDVFINGNKVVNGLKYQNFSNYTNLPDGSYDIKVFPSSANGGGVPVVDASGFRIGGGSLNTIVVVGKGNSIAALPLTDDNTAPAAGKARVRFVHASPDAPIVDVAAEGLGNVFSNVSFKSIGNYIEVPAGAVKLSAKPTNGSEALFTKSLNFEAGKVYTLFAIGQVSDKSLDVVWSVDNSAPNTMPASGKGAPIGLAQNQLELAGIWQLSLILVAAVGLLGFLKLRQANQNKQ